MALRFDVRASVIDAARSVVAVCMLVLMVIGNGLAGIHTFRASTNFDDLFRIS